MIPIMLDLDLAMGAPGSDIDDGFALALALADPDLDLRLATTVNGNTDVDTATTLTGSQLQLYRYLTEHRDGARYLFAVQGWTAAGPYILATGQAVLPMGGFSGSVPEPTLARVKQLVAAGQLRFFMLGGGGGFAGPGGRGGGETAQIEAWVESSCHTVQVPGADSTGTLYQCGTR